MAAARQAAEALKLDKLLLIPTRVPPHKALTEDVAGPEHRLEMTRFAVQALNLDGVAEASDLELRREGKSYTLDTLREIRALYPKGELFLLLGTDMFLTRRRSPSCVPSAPFTAAPWTAPGILPPRSGGWNGSSAPT